MAQCTSFKCSLERCVMTVTQISFKKKVNPQGTCNGRVDKKGEIFEVKEIGLALYLSFSHSRSLFL